MANTSGRRDEPLVSASQVRRAMTSLMPDLEDFWKRPLIDYAHAVYDDFERGNCSVRNDAMGRLQDLIRSVASTCGADQEQANLAAKQLAEHPVIQSGPHCFLMVDPDVFYTHLFNALGLTLHKRRWHIYFGCSTVKFIERGNKGPGLLTTGGQTLNIFGLSRSYMASKNLCGRDRAVSFKFETNDTGAMDSPIAFLRRYLSDRTFPSAADALMAANQNIWRQTFPPSLELLQFDDADVGHLLASHFEDPDSWLSRRFLGKGMVAENILNELDKLNGSPWAGWVRRTTDFFWELSGGRILPLRLKNGILETTNASGFSVPFDPKQLAEALRNRRIIPNLVMMAIVTSILPGVRLLGGSRQIIYLPLMRYVFANALDPERDQALLAAMQSDKHLSMWGHRVLRPIHADPLSETDKNQHGLAVAAAYGQQRLEVTAGDLAFFTGDPVWQQMCERLASNQISTSSHEWQWT